MDKRMSGYIGGGIGQAGFPEEDIKSWHLKQMTGMTNSVPQERPMGPIDSALCDLNAITSDVEMSFQYLVDKLAPVLGMSPVDRASEGGIGKGPSCEIEERVAIVSARLRALLANIDAVKSRLCL
jgi:hypothetical protein